MPEYLSTLSDNASTLVAKYFNPTADRSHGGDSLSTALNDPQTDFTSSQQDKTEKKLRIPSKSVGKALLPSSLFQRRQSYSSATETRDLKSSTLTETQEQLAILGYRQELHRSWDFWSLFSLSFCNVAVITGALTELDAAYASWGPVLMTAGVIVTASLWVCVNAVFAEMASAFPISGAMFSWTFKLARSNPRLRDWARLLSWIVGFCLFTSHVLVQVEIGKEFSGLLRSIVISWGINWDATDTQIRAVALIYIFACGCTSLTPLARSPLAWKIIGMIILILNLAACVVLRTTSSHQGNFNTLFSVYPKHKEFPSRGYTLLRAWAITTVLIGSEPAAHMAEETRNPASTLPRAMFYSSIFSGFWQLFCNTCIALAITPMHRPPSRSWRAVQLIFLHCPKPAAQFIMISIAITAFVSNTAQFLGTSRFFWALARDKALPFAKFWRQVTSDRRPVRATCLMISVCLIMAALSLEPTESINQLARLGVPFLVFFSYLTPLLIYLFADKGVLDRDGRNVFTLRCFSKPLALISALFITFMLAIFAGPDDFPITPKTFPLGPFVGLGVILISTVFWIIYGKSHFVGPVKSLTTWTVGYEVDLPTKMTRVVARAGQTATVQQTGPIAPGQTQDPRSEANLSTTNHNQTFGIPSAYRTCGSDGSLWTETGEALEVE